VLGIYAAALACGRAVTNDGQVTLTAKDAARALGALGFFITVRVIDEHSDYEADMREHPDRALQRSEVTLADLRAVAVVSTAVQVAACLSAAAPAAAVSAWVVASAWSLLWGTELFGLLRPPRALVVVAHVMLVPLAALWLAQLGARHGTLAAPVWELGGAALLATMAIEAARMLGKLEGGPDRTAYALGLAAAVAVAGSAALLAVARDALPGAAGRPGSAVLVIALLAVAGAIAGGTARWAPRGAALTVALAAIGELWLFALGISLA
jgi:hypothetical protein